MKDHAPLSYVTIVFSKTYSFQKFEKHIGGFVLFDNATPLVLNGFLLHRFLKLAKWLSAFPFCVVPWHSLRLVDSMLFDYAIEPCAAEFFCRPRHETLAWHHSIFEASEMVKCIPFCVVLCNFLNAWFPKI